MTKPRMVVPLLAAAMLAASAVGQVSVLEGGPELDRLEFLEGTWRGELTRYLPGDRKLELTPGLTVGREVGGVWLRAEDTTRLPDGTRIHNVTRLTWHPRDREYVGAWQDNVFPGFVTFRGRWLDDERLELDTGEFELAGRSHRVVFVYRKASADEFCTEMRQAWDGGRPEKVAEGCFRRAS